MVGLEIFLNLKWSSSYLERVESPDLRNLNYVFDLTVKYSSSNAKHCAVTIMSFMMEFLKKE